MSERRYREDEVRAIFERAAEAQQTARRHLPPADGMTLGELQEIGAEVGIPADLVARAAHSLDDVRGPPARRLLGLPFSVQRTVDLGRRLTDEEWDRLVVDLRETFDARGTVRTEGSFRHWSNGNLQALLEPTPNGQRLRLKTLKGSSRALIGAGLLNFAITGAMAIAFAVVGEAGDPGSWAAVAFLGTAGIALVGAGVLPLPGWARTRQRQFEAIAARLLATMPGTAASEAIGDSGDHEHDSA